jgi:hypothetical protein
MPDEREVAREKAHVTSAHDRAVEVAAKALMRQDAVERRYALSGDAWEHLDLTARNVYRGRALAVLAALAAVGERSREHTVQQGADRTGYGYRATCSCGWTATASSLDGVETAGDVHRVEVGERRGADCAACGAPAGYPPAGPCPEHPVGEREAELEADVRVLERERGSIWDEEAKKTAEARVEALTEGVEEG